MKTNIFAAATSLIRNHKAQLRLCLMLALTLLLLAPGFAFADKKKKTGAAPPPSVMRSTAPVSAESCSHRYGSC